MTYAALAEEIEGIENERDPLRVLLARSDDLLARVEELNRDDIAVIPRDVRREMEELCVAVECAPFAGWVRVTHASPAPGDAGIMQAAVDWMFDEVQPGLLARLARPWWRAVLGKYEQAALDGGEEE